MVSEVDIEVFGTYVERTTGKSYLVRAVGKHSETGERLVGLLLLGGDWDNEEAIFMTVEKFLGQDTHPNDPSISFPRFSWVPERD